MLEVHRFKGHFPGARCIEVSSLMGNYVMPTYATDEENSIDAES